MNDLDHLARKLGSVQALKEEIEKQREKISTASWNISKITDPILEEKGHFPFAMEIGMWDCECSPFGFCAYNRYEDPAFDDCVFCHQPMERK